MAMLLLSVVRKEVGENQIEQCTTRDVSPELDNDIYPTNQEGEPLGHSQIMLAQNEFVVSRLMCAN